MSSIWAWLQKAAVEDSRITRHMVANNTETQRAADRTSLQGQIMADRQSSHNMEARNTRASKRPWLTDWPRPRVHISAASSGLPSQAATDTSGTPRDGVGVRHMEGVRQLHSLDRACSWLTSNHLSLPRASRKGPR